MKQKQMKLSKVEKEYKTRMLEEQFMSKLMTQVNQMIQEETSNVVQTTIESNLKSIYEIAKFNNDIFFIMDIAESFASEFGWDNVLRGVLNCIDFKNKDHIESLKSICESYVIDAVENEEHEEVENIKDFINHINNLIKQ